ncbi:MAG TPA: xanthine dehydrogenase family protein subunit M [Caldilineaceae bacterium]|nr:xanthine dehydrogenase family protein subunit M [Caldilineaceae bacterium]
MYPPKFDYQRAGSVDEALSALQQGAKVLAGGHSLIPALKLRLADPGTLVDIGRLDGLKGITVNGNTATIGALTTHAMVAKADNLPAALTEAAGMIGDPAVRNRGTVGGNIAHADPASDLPTVFVGLGATINLTGPNGNRSVAAADFFIDLFYTALEENELVVSVDVPLGDGGSAYAKLFNPASRYAIVGACAKVSVSGGTCSAASVAIGGLTPNAKQASSVAAALVGKALTAETIQAAAAAVANDLGEDVMGDIHASEEYRRAMAPVYVGRALTAAAARA